MKKCETTKTARRKFLALGLLGGAGLFTAKATAMTPLSEEDEKVSMLTPDGKLVEVSKKILEKSTQRGKASNKDILNWSENTKKSIEK
jgi:hypothetical protein